MEISVPQEYILDFIDTCSISNYVKHYNVHFSADHLLQLQFI